MTPSIRWTSADLEALPDDGKRYEIIDGELFMSKQPSWHHRDRLTNAATASLSSNSTRAVGF